MCLEELHVRNRPLWFVSSHQGFRKIDKWCEAGTKKKLSHGTTPRSLTMFYRNHGRNKHGRGHTNRVRCSSTAKAIPKDKAIKRFSVRNIVDASALRDIRDASAYDNYNMPKLYIKQYYCIEAAVHQRIVRVRSKEDRKIREPPARVRPARF